MSSKQTKALEGITAALHNVFPARAEFNRDPAGDNALRVRWQLTGQPERLAQYSRDISIRFAASALDAYATLDPNQRKRADAQVRTIIMRRLLEYDEGNDTSRYAVQLPFVIEIPHDFLE